MLNKVLILSLTALLVVAVGRIWAQAPDTLWSENWENPDWLNDWHVDAGTWEVGTPNAGPNGAYSGQQCAGTVLAGNYPSNANTRLIRHTSFIVPSANQNPRLRFWHWYNIYSDDQAYVQIKVEEGDWQTISETYTNTGSGIWTYPAIDLSAYSDSTVQIAFYFHSGGYNNSTGWYIDDIVVLTGPLVYNNPESWEAGLGDWYADRGTWEVGEPTSGPGSAYSGQNCLATVLAGNYSGSASSRFISPAFIIPGANQNPRLRFWHWYNIYSDDEAFVQIRVVGGEWQTISETYTNTGSGVWTYPAIDLSAYSDSTVQIAFYFHSGGYNNSTGWYIDDIAVLTGPLVYNNPESWEAGLGDWYADRGTWEVGEPTSGPGSAYSGQNCLATVLAGNYSGSASSRFISPAFILPGASENPNLTFWHWYNIYSDDEAFVQIRVVGGNWETILGPYTNTSGGIWSPTYADLSWYADSTVQIAFYFHSGGYNNSTGWYIDDINIMPYIITGTENSIKHKIPKHFQLSQNYPNPFNPSTTIEFNLPKTCEVTLKVFNILGEEVATLVSDRLSAGSYSYEWDASNLASGIYLYRLAAEGYVETKKMMLMK